MKNLTLKQRAGLQLMREGASLFFIDDESKEVFKRKINADTWVGSMAGSGGHIHSSMEPMSDFDTQSVINVLIHWEGNLIDGNSPLTEFKTYYKEKWLA